MDGMLAVLARVPKVESEEEEANYQTQRELQSNLLQSIKHRPSLSLFSHFSEIQISSGRKV